MHTYPCVPPYTLYLATSGLPQLLGYMYSYLKNYCSFSVARNNQIETVSIHCISDIAGYKE